MLTIGQTFASYAEFQDAFAKYKNNKFYDFSVSDSRSLNVARKRYPLKLKNTPDSLKYYSVKFICVHGGVHKQKKTCLQLRSTTTMKQDCPAFIYVRLSDDGTKLEISKINYVHNHTTSEVLFSNLPNQRRLTPRIKSEELELIEMRANNKLILDELHTKHDKVITLKDLFNIHSTERQHDTFKYYKLIENLQKRYDCTVEVFTDSDQNLLGIFIQDQRMKNEFIAFPEVVCAETSYELLDLKRPINVLLVEDGNGLSSVVAIGLLINDLKKSLQWFFKMFKDHNPSVSDTKAFVTNKDKEVQSVIKSLFPHVCLVICLFHSMLEFSTDIKNEQLKITPDEQDLINKMFEELCNSKNEEHYQTIYLDFKKRAPQQIIDYFEENWHDIRIQWVRGIIHNSGIFFSSANNRLESFNAKLKSVTPIFSNLQEFFEKLFVILKCLRLKIDSYSLNIAQKCPTMNFNSNNLLKYYKLLTPYAFGYLNEQLTSQETHILQDTTINFCSCGFYKSVRLPCKHIFAKRKQMNSPIYDEKLCNKRWTREYLFESQTIFKNEEQESKCNEVDIINVGNLTTHEKLRKASIHCTKMAELLSTSDQLHFEKRMEQLKHIIALWSNKQEFVLSV